MVIGELKAGNEAWQMRLAGANEYTTDANPNATATVL